MWTHSLSYFLRFLKADTVQLSHYEVFPGYEISPGVFFLSSQPDLIQHSQYSVNPVATQDLSAFVLYNSNKLTNMFYVIDFIKHFECLYKRLNFISNCYLVQLVDFIVPWVLNIHAAIMLKWRRFISQRISIHPLMVYRLDRSRTELDILLGNKEIYVIHYTPYQL